MEQDDSQKPKKDLTGLNDFKFPEMEADPSNASGPSISLTEETPFEKVESFESLDTLTPQASTESIPSSEPTASEPAPNFTFESPAELGGTLSAAHEPEFSQALLEKINEPMSQLPTTPEPNLSFNTEPMPPPPSPEMVMEQVKKFSENLAPATAVAAAYPFSLRIEGPLKPEEQEKIVDLISKEKMGIRAMDLELQFKTGKILIPRISEYAGILLVQALRGIQAEIKLAPSDQIFSTEDTRADTVPEKESHTVSSIADASPFEHPAEHIPVTSEHVLPGTSPGVIIDTIAASATIKAMTVEMETSAEYLEILENLKRELKYKSFHKGGNAVVDFKVQLSPLSIPTHYRITAMGSAAKMDQTKGTISSVLNDIPKDWEPIV